MSYIAQIREAQQKLERKQALKGRLPELEKQKKDLEYMVAKRQQVAREEQRDVDRMENGGALVMLKRLFGGREDQLEKERREAYEASSRYQAAAWELDQVTREWERANAEWKALENAEQEYATAMEGRRQELIAMGGVRGADVESLSEEVASLRVRLEVLKKVSDIGVAIWAEIKRLDDMMGEVDAEVVGGMGYRRRYGGRYEMRDEAARILSGFLTGFETFEEMARREGLDTSGTTATMLDKWKKMGPLDETDKLVTNIKKVRLTEDYVEETMDIVRVVMAELERQWKPLHERYQKLDSQLKDRILQSCNE